MLIRTVVSPLLGTNCYVVGDSAGRCVVVDPGFGVTTDVLRIVEHESLTVAAVLATHGHVDHTWAAAELCDTLGVAFHVHSADAYRIADPFGSLGALGGQLAEMARSLGEEYRMPRRVETFGSAAPDDHDDDRGGAAGGIDLPLFAGLTGLSAPGHTQGSTVFLLADGAGSGELTALTGDVLFAATIGRTDLPGGDPALMSRTLERVARLDPATVVLPGHGPASSIAAELAVNPYLSVPG